MVLSQKKKIHNMVKPVHRAIYSLTTDTVYHYTLPSFSFRFLIFFIYIIQNEQQQTPPLKGVKAIPLESFGYCIIFSSPCTSLGNQCELKHYNRGDKEAAFSIRINFGYRKVYMT